MHHGLKSIALAAGLLFAPLSLQSAAAQAPQSPVAQAPQPAAEAQAPQDVTLQPQAAEIATPVTTANAAAEATPTVASPPSLRPEADIGQPIPGAYGLPAQVSPNGRQAKWIHDIILMPIITLISLFVLGLLLYVMVRYRRAANPVPSKTTHNTFIEVVWTLVPVLILVAIAVPSIDLLARQYKPAPANAVTLKAIGNQWYWTYQYPDHGGFEVTANMLKEQDKVPAGERFRTAADGPRLLAVDNRIVVPVGITVRLITTSNDVIHSWALPAAWIKMDAVPGRLNETSFLIDRPGLYFGQCSELCGARHAFMPIAVEAVSPAQFAQWVASKGGTMPGARPAGGQVAPLTTPSAPPAADAEATLNASAEGTPAPATPGTATGVTTSQGATANPSAPGSSSDN